MSSYGSPSLHAQHASLAAAQAGSPAHSLSLSALAAPSPTAQFLGLHHGSSSQSLHGQQQLHHHLQPGSTRAGSLGAGGVGAPSTTLGTGTGANSTTSSDAPNEARKLIRILLDQGGDAQGRLSLVRIQREVEGLLLDVQEAFSRPSSASAERLSDLLATLDELQHALARTGLGALPISENGEVDYSNVQALIAETSTEVQNSFRARQRVRDGAGVVVSVFKQ